MDESVRDGLPNPGGDTALAYTRAGIESYAEQVVAAPCAAWRRDGR